MNTPVSLRYHFAARLLHWIIAVGLVFMWLCGFSMMNFVDDDSAMESLLLFLHISVGLTLLVALIARVVIRLLYKPPPLLDAISKFDRIGAHFTHAILYAIPFLVILVGWVTVDFGGDQVHWFGINVPKIFPTMETVGGIEVDEVAEMVHRWLAYTMLGIALVHVAVVFKHRWFDKHDILPRMTFGNQS